MPSLPSFKVLRQHYPDQDPDTVKRTIGGKVDADWITNTCAVRLSRAFNYSGITIPHGLDALKTISGADGKWYAYRMRELKHWIGETFGAPDLSRDGQVTRAEFAGVTGIVAFDIHFNDASGHLDLWDGSSYIHQSSDPRDYFTMASKVVLWKC